MEKKSTFFIDVLRSLRAAQHKELATIARRSGVSEGTVRKLFYGEVKNPRIQTVQALHDYFELARRGAANEKRLMTFSTSGANNAMSTTEQK